jgi:hypothetical protein
MWSEDPGPNAPKTTEEPKSDERKAERVSGAPAPLRWFFGFDGWRLDADDDEFVLA